MLCKILNHLAHFLVGIDLNDNRIHKHLWVDANVDIEHEREVHFRHMIRPDLRDLCRIYNLIKENPHEGAGWWERLIVANQEGFSIDEQTKVLDSEGYTYLPQEIVKDLERASGRVIGFKPNNPDPNERETVVWIHLV